jgi:hypothetical protein
VRPPELAGPGGGPWLCHTQLRILALRGCCAEEYRGCGCGAGDVRAVLAPEDARRVEAGRPALLDLKIAVLRRLAEAARRQCVEGLWDDCLKLLTGALRADDAGFWLRMDEVHGGAPARDGILASGFKSHAVGGFSALLRLIGWFEVPATFKWLQAARRALACLPRVGRPASYFDLAGRPERSDLDQALDRVRSIAGRRREAWGAFGHKVNAALDTEFEEEVMVPVRVKRAVAGRFHADADAWAGLLGAFAKLGVPPTAFDPASGAALARLNGPRNLKTLPSPFNVYHILTLTRE